jgi:release factor glutamine methyltransferase
MTIHEATQQLLFQLYHLYDNRESANIADWVMEKITEWKKIDRVINKTVPLSDRQKEQLLAYTTQLLTHEPVQYVLNECWFYHMKLFVNKEVLIPRPETEELVEWIAGDTKNKITAGNKILDIGTGSGCIALALKKAIPLLQVDACDISGLALEVAQKNASENNLGVCFHQVDFLNEAEREKLPLYDILVSNPPYIPASEKATMANNVLLHEPHTALFVADNDPLVFYKAIIDFATLHLSNTGAIYIEIHEQAAASIKDLFLAHGYKDVVVKKDLQQKERMVKVVRA